VRSRLVAALAVALFCVVYWLTVSRLVPSVGSDLDQLWQASHALPGDPYAAVHRGVQGPSYRYAFNLYYPLPAVWAVWPLGFLRIDWARGLFSALMFAPMTYMLAKRGWWGLVPLASGAALTTLTVAQWNGLISLAVLVPLVGVISGAGKPNAWLAVVAAQPRKSIAAAIGAALLLLASLLIAPGWLKSWLGAIHGAPNFEPLAFQWFGVLLLLSALRLSDSRMRWLLAMALSPVTPNAYTGLPLLLLDGWSRRQLLALSLLSHAALWLAFYLAAHNHNPDGLIMYSARAMSACFYLPAMVLALLQKPSRTSDEIRWK
jgi:hypothetical protein